MIIILQVRQRVGGGGGKKKRPNQNPATLHVTDGKSAEVASRSYLVGILARLRAMASSTAFSCFRSSSRRDNVLLGFPEPDPEPGPGAEDEAAAGGLPDDEGAMGPFPEDLGGGDRGRFLSPWGGIGRGP